MSSVLYTLFTTSLPSSQGKLTTPHSTRVHRDMEKKYRAIPPSKPSSALCAASPFRNRQPISFVDIAQPHLDAVVLCLQSQQMRWKHQMKLEEEQQKKRKKKAESQDTSNMESSFFQHLFGWNSRKWRGRLWLDDRSPRYQ